MLNKLIFDWLYYYNLIVKTFWREKTILVNLSENYKRGTNHEFLITTTKIWHEIYVCYRYISLSRLFTEIQQFSYFFDLYSASTYHLFCLTLRGGRRVFKMEVSLGCPLPLQCVYIFFFLELLGRIQIF